MNILDFAGEVVFLSASGVLSPGPLFLLILFVEQNKVIEQV